MLNNLIKKTGFRKLVMALVCGFMSVPSTTVQAGEIIDRIKSDGKLTVATEAAYPPFEFIKDGEITGYSKHILDYIVADLEVELDQLDLPFQGILPGLLAKKYDFVATSVSVNEKRAKNYAFTRPVGTNQTVLLVRDGESSINSLEDLSGKVVATQLGSSFVPVAEEHIAELKAAGKDGYADLKLFSAIPETFVALASSQVDAVIVGSVQAGDLMGKRPGTFKIVANIGNPKFMSWATRPENKDLRDYINVKIGELVDNGKIAEWQMKWFGFHMEMPSENYLPEGAQ